MPPLRQQARSPVPHIRVSAFATKEFGTSFCTANSKLLKQPRATGRNLGKAHRFAIASPGAAARQGYKPAIQNRPTDRI